MQKRSDEENLIVINYCLDSDMFGKLQIELAEKEVVEDVIHVDETTRRVAVHRNTNQNNQLAGTARQQPTPIDCYLLGSTFLQSSNSRYSVLKMTITKKKMID